MKKRKLIIDTDPGIDDAIALAIALHSKKVDVELITTVAGNVGIEYVTTNVLKLLNFWGKKVPVAKGAVKPLVVPLVDASNVHGAEGMGGYEFPEPDKSLLLKKSATEAIYEQLKKGKDKKTLVAIGPLTNIAMLVSSYPDVGEYVEEVVLMGGTITRGNKGVLSEFNFATDPEAAKIVFKSNLKITMLPLDVGWKALLDANDSAKIKKFNKNGEMIYSIFQKYRGGSLINGLKMYDSCAIGYILNPSMFTMKKVYVEIETKGEFTSGCSLVDLKGYLKQEPNALVATDIDPVEFKRLILNELKNI